MVRKVAVTVSALSLAALLAVACSVATPLAVFTEAGAPLEAGSAPAGVNVECVSCVHERCSTELTSCNAEPTCARHRECVEACAPTAKEDRDPACVAACPPPAGSAAEQAAADLEDCRLKGAGNECESCLAHAGNEVSPLLRQSCENPTWDAGADASAEREACQRCIAERCCESSKRCNDDPNCNPLLDCWGECSDHACMEACFDKYDSAVGHTFEVVSCDQIRCYDECGFANNACMKCDSTLCANELIECSANHDCWRLSNCITSQEVVDECRAKYPGGIELFDKHLSCVTNRCASCL